MNRFNLRRAAALLLVVCTAVSMTGSDVFAADAETGSVAMGEFSVNAKDNAGTGEIVDEGYVSERRGYNASYYGSITSVTRTVTETSVSITWNDTLGVGNYALRYYVYYGSDCVAQNSDAVIGRNSYTLTGLTQGSYVVFYIYRDGKYTNYASSVYVDTTPGRITGFDYEFGSGYDLKVAWDYYTGNSTCCRCGNV